MAYISSTDKAKLAPGIKAVLNKYGVKGTLAVRNRTSLVLNIKSGKIDFISNMNAVCGSDHYQVARGFRPAKDYIDVNPYWFHDHFDGVAKQFLTEIIDAMKGPDYFDHSDAQTDYFHRSHYFDVNIGKYDKPYEVTA